VIDGQAYYARVPVEVGAAKIDPVDVALAAAPSLSGTISAEGDAKIPNNLRVVLNPLERRPLMRPPPQAGAGPDGVFHLNSVMPGRWRLLLTGASVYLKSVTAGDQDISPDDFAVGETPVSLKIVVGSKFGQIDASIADPVAGSEPVSGFLWSTSSSHFQQSFMFSTQSQPVMNAPPGHYVGCAVAGLQPGPIQDYALRKALESRCAAIDLEEGGHATIQMPLLSMTDLERVIEKIEE
jgi:hypothetical protein